VITDSLSVYILLLDTAGSGRTDFDEPSGKYQGHHARMIWRSASALCSAWTVMRKPADRLQTNCKQIVNKKTAPYSEIAYDRYN